VMVDNTGSESSEGSDMSERLVRVPDNDSDDTIMASDDTIMEESDDTIMSDDSFVTAGEEPEEGEQAGTFFKCLNNNGRNSVCIVI